MMKKLILASASPRRRDLLTQIGLEFETIPSTVEEKTDETEPVKLVAELALLKASDVASRVEGLVIGADTIVVDGKTVLGKPRSNEEAVHMLQRLSGRQHQVMTGVAIVDPESGKHWVDVEITQVNFRELNLQEIQHYVDSGEPMDKAGAYAIQQKGALFVKAIEGDYFNVVGLPLLKTVQLLEKAGVNILEYV
jgi:septum formation protein